MRVKSLEKVLQGVSDAAKALDEVLDPSGTSRSQTQIEIDTDCAAQGSYSVRMARDRLWEALKDAAAKCEPLQISDNLPSLAILEHGPSRLDTRSLPDTNGDSGGSVSSSGRSGLIDYFLSDKHRDSSILAGGGTNPASTKPSSPPSSRIIHIPCRPPSLFVAEEGSSFSTILLWQAMVAAHFHLKQLLTVGTSTSLTQTMFSLTARHEAPTDTMHRISTALQARYTGRGYHVPNFYQYSEMMRLHDRVVRDLLLSSHESLDNYLDVYQVEAYLRHLCGGGVGSSSSSTPRIKQTTMTLSPDYATSSASQRSASPLSQQVLSTVIKTLAPKGVCFGDGPRYRVEVVEQVFWAVLRSQLQVPHVSPPGVDMDLVQELNFSADLKAIDPDGDLWNS